MDYTNAGTAQIERARRNAHLFVHEAATLCGVSVRTFNKWETTGNIPVMALNLLLTSTGALWKGWHFRNGVIYDDVGREYHQGTFMAAYHTLKAAEAKNIEFLNPRGGDLRHENTKKAKRAHKPSSISVPDFQEKRQKCLNI